LPINFKKKN